MSEKEKTSNNTASNVFVNNILSLIGASWLILVIAAIIGIGIGSYDYMLLHSWGGIAATSALVAFTMLVFHLRMTTLLRNRYGLRPTFVSKPQTLGALFVCMLAFIILVIAGILPLWLHSHISLEALQAVAMGDTTDLPSYFDALGLLCGAVFMPFTLISSLVFYIPLCTAKSVASISR
ncbi:MAG: hypothetical protein J5486_06645 [Bacteroidaceae bacterium]|nr:hypothetical protein [Bacteroidaceae bacterium]